MPSNFYHRNGYIQRPQRVHGPPVESNATKASLKMNSAYTKALVAKLTLTVEPAYHTRTTPPTAIRQAHDGCSRSSAWVLKMLGTCTINVCAAAIVAIDTVSGLVDTVRKDEARRLQETFLP
jgi:hypothetical protein